MWVGIIIRLKHKWLHAYIWYHNAKEEYVCCQFYIKQHNSEDPGIWGSFDGGFIKKLVLWQQCQTQEVMLKGLAEII